MRTTSFRVTGPALDLLPDELAHALQVTAVVKHGAVSVLCHEKYYVRIDSNLMTTIVISEGHDGVCFVDIVTGGGEKGLPGVSFGAEGRNTDLVSDTLKAVCADLDLRILH